MMYSKVAGCKVLKHFSVTLKPCACSGAARAAMLQRTNRQPNSRLQQRDEGMISVFRQLVPCHVTQYSTYDANLAALLRKSKINCDQSFLSLLWRIQQTYKKKEERT